MKFTLTGFLIGVNVVAYAWQSTTNGGIDTDHGWLTPQSALQYGEWWRIVTSAFLHGGIAHIGMNMLALYWIGIPVEMLFGKARFAAVYALSIAGSGLAVIYFSAYTVPTLGASGAIYGLLGAIGAVGLRLGTRGRPLVMRVLPVVVLNLAFTFAIPFISAAAHIGGLITGFLAGLVLFTGSGRREFAYAYAASFAAEPPAGDAVRPREPVTIEHEPQIETIEHPPAAGPHG